VLRGKGEEYGKQTKFGKKKHRRNKGNFYKKKRSSLIIKRDASSFQRMGNFLGTGGGSDWKRVRKTLVFNVRGETYLLTLGTCELKKEV